MRAFLLDIDGTTLLGPDAIPGAAEFIAHLDRSGIPYLWLTNNTSRSREGWRRRLTAAGFHPDIDDVYTAGDATIDYLHSLVHPPKVYLVGTAELHGEFEAAGITLDDQDPDLVVLGYDLELTYDKIQKAALFLEHGVDFVATHPDLTCPTPDGPVPDVGSFIAMFEAATGCTPRVIGKPEATMIRGALSRLDVDASDAVMVGDRPATDIRMAKRAGVRSFLVLSGVTKREDPVALEDTPAEVFDSLAEVLEFVRR